MAIGNKSVGADIRLRFNTINGVLQIPPDLIGDFEADPESDWKDWLPVTGIQEMAVLPKCWGGKISLIRKGPLLDQFWAQFESAFYAGVSIQAGSILETISEPDGTTSQWNYINTLFRLTKAGSWKGNEFVMQELEFRSSRKLPVNF